MKRLAALLGALLLSPATVLATPQLTPLLVDVRTPAEFADGHVAGALNLPLDDIAASIVRRAPDRQAPIALYCRSGRRSAAAEQQLRQLGYRNVRNLGSLEAARVQLATEGGGVK